MERLRNSIEQAVREAERLGQPPTVAARPPFPPRPRRLSPPDREGQDAEPGASGAVKTPTAPPVPRPRPLDLRAMLGSRAGLRQAFLLQEILGPPRALRAPDGEGR